MNLWDKVKRIDSGNENVSKYVFEKNDAVAEAVLYKYPTYETRTVICCSTQSGCPVGCRFCGAGDSFVRSLTADEVVSQVDHLMSDKQIDHEKVERMQIMFMSMGEPMLNGKALRGALYSLYQSYPKAALLVSTVGPDVDFSWFRDVSREIPTIGLQFSVHESLDERRGNLIPFQAKLSLRQLVAEGIAWSEATGRKPFFNYCAHAENSSDQDVGRLLELFDPRTWNATVSVICERDEHVAAANERQRELATDFSSKLLAAGFDVRTFDPAGQDDIGGGCGQLWFVQDWMKQHPKQSRPSIGSRLPVIHTPRG